MSRQPPTAQPDKSFPEKLKQFFRFNKGAGGLSRSRSDESIVLTEELVIELGKDSSPSVRLKAVRDFTELSKSRRLEVFTIEKLWTLTADLLLPTNPKETRHTVFNLFTNLTRNHSSAENGFLRGKFFEFIQAHEVPDDVVPRFEFLKSLTDNGRDMSYFDERIGPFLLTWMSGNEGLIKIKDFMEFLGNVVKFNQSFLDGDVLEGIIQNLCFISCTCPEKDKVSDTLAVLSAVVCYPSLPPTSLSTFLATLCRTVNVDLLTQQSWKIMRDLLGTHLGHSALLTMCGFMGEGTAEDIAVVRGAVFFVGVALWGSKVVRSLKYSTLVVMAAMRRAVSNPNPLIAYEIIMRLQDLVRHKPDSLESLSWDELLCIIERVLPNSGGKIMEAVNETLDVIEVCIESGHFSGSIEKFYSVIDSCVRGRGSQSVSNLLRFKSKALRSTCPNWLDNLNHFITRHFVNESRPHIKVIAIGHISQAARANMDTHEQEVSEIILRYFKSLETEPVIVRTAAVSFIVDWLMEAGGSRRSHDLIHILERVINAPFDCPEGSQPQQIPPEQLTDVHNAVQGLIRLFIKKIYVLPSSIAISCYKIIVRHLSHHYKKSKCFELCPSIRFMIFECFFKIRANSLYHLGFPDPETGVVTYSPYLAVDHKEGVGGQEQVEADAVVLPNRPPVSFVSLYIACQLVVQSLKKEKDWSVLSLILQQIPTIMENKALILSKHGNDIDFLANALCTMMMDKSLGYPELLRNIPPKFGRSDFQVYLYPILSALVSYHSHLESSVQVKIVKCLEHGLVSKCSRICILSLSTCSLEMKDIMHKLLPEVLLSLSKISPKIAIAIPVLEFLSTLIHLPRVFASFVQDQYMSIFAIALPYTNPFKFNQYTVSLAHHVIAMWFLKCRLSFRRGFVSYIIKGLKQNVWAPFDEDTRLSLNEDSSNRKRSSSLTESSQKRRERAVSGHSSRPPQLTDLTPSVKKAMKIFHDELTETCVDLLARYAFADCSALPTRFPSTEFLLKGGNAQTWLMDNKIITVTVSGCSGKELREGLCDKCWLLCKCDEGGSGNVGPRRRHRSATVTAYKREEGRVTSAVGVVKDDMEMRSGSGNGGKREEITEFKKSDFCSCWCQGWAEIHVRRPTGNTSWMMRVQNQLGRDLPIAKLSAMLVKRGDTTPIGPTSPPPSPSKQMVHRSNSSPDIDSVRGFRPDEDLIAEIDEPTSETPQSQPPSQPSLPPELNYKKTYTIPEESMSPITRDRTATITVMSPAIKNKGLRRMMSGPETPHQRLPGTEPIRSGLSPSFIFLQLCAQGVFGGGGAKPLLLQPTQANEKSLKVLDYIPPYETHKIGVIYVGKGQSKNESAILQNTYGSTRYRDFCSGLGSLIKLSEVDPAKIFLGGLGRDGGDGEFGYIWEDDVMQVIFHVATLMPNKPTDPSGNGKKLHIGNDYVAIVYNNSGEDYDIGTIKGQFLYASVIIEPLDHKTNRVIVKAKPVLSDNIGHNEAKIVSDQNLPVMARQLALHSNLASVIFQGRERPDPYASNWLERLRNIKRLRARLISELPGGGLEPEAPDASGAGRPAFSVDDFTEFV